MLSSWLYKKINRSNLPPQKGKCNICGFNGEFLFPEKGREGLHCPNCNSTSRHRAVIHITGKLLNQGKKALFSWPRNSSIKILESSARGFYSVLLNEKFNYYSTEYDPNKIAKGKDKKRYADFQNLQYLNDEFNIVIASDVFEHIRRDEDAFKEVYRVLKHSGFMILTIPYDHKRQRTIIRVDTTGENDILLMEPIYHGGGGHTLMYRNYGRDLLTFLSNIGFIVSYFELDVDSNGISRQSVIVCSKSDYIELYECQSEDILKSTTIILLAYRLSRLLKLNIKAFKNIWEIYRKK